MVCRMPKTRSGDPGERGRLDMALAQATEGGRRLRALVDEDSAAYDAVVARYGDQWISLRPSDLTQLIYQELRRLDAEHIAATKNHQNQG